MRAQLLERHQLSPVSSAKVGGEELLEFFRPNLRPSPLPSRERAMTTIKGSSVSRCPVEGSSANGPARVRERIATNRVSWSRTSSGISLAEGSRESASRQRNSPGYRKVEEEHPGLLTQTGSGPPVVAPDLCEEGGAILAGAGGMVRESERGHTLHSILEEGQSNRPPKIHVPLKIQGVGKYSDDQVLRVHWMQWRKGRRLA